MPKTKEYIFFLEKALQNANVKAFLWMIRKCEGTSAKDGYNYLFGSSPKNARRFKSFEKHPKIPYEFKVGTKTQRTDAAGAYQFLGSTYDDLVKTLGVKDFKPYTQELMAAELISQRNCLQILMNGGFMVALKKCATTWASLPDAPYGQPIKTVEECKAWYLEAGGTIMETI